MAATVVVWSRANVLPVVVLLKMGLWDYYP